MRFRSRDPDETRGAGRLLSEALGGHGGVVGLVGPLGVGKTVLVKGMAEGFGVEQALVASPTFAIANEYPLARGGLLAHVDLYRLESDQELEDAGFLDWLEPENVVVVEWADRLPGVLPEDRVEIRMEREPGSESQRRFGVHAGGPLATAIVDDWRLRLEAGRFAEVE